MPSTPASVAAFLAGKRFAVAGVSRDSRQPANAIYRKLRDAGYEVVPVNPAAGEVEGARCYPDLRSVPGPVDGLMFVARPDVAADLAAQCAALGIRRVWLHRGIGGGSVSDEAVAACRSAGIEPIVGGCPMMYCEPVDVFHRCLGWWLRRRGRIAAS